MSLPPAIKCGDALIVFEGARRIRWRRSERSSHASVVLWPDPLEALEVRRRLERGWPILVILGGPQAEAALLTEQYAQAPPALAAVARTIATDMTGMPVPALDWLPVGLRNRGLRFLRASSERVHRTPAPLCPSLQLDERDLTVPHVRFAHVVRESAQSERDLELVVAHAFSDVTPLELLS
jgi:hypothetical protein